MCINIYSAYISIYVYIFHDLLGVININHSNIYCFFVMRSLNITAGYFEILLTIVTLIECISFICYFVAINQALPVFSFLQLLPASVFFILLRTCSESGRNFRHFNKFLSCQIDLTLPYCL